MNDGGYYFLFLFMMGWQATVKGKTVK